MEKNDAGNPKHSTILDTSNFSKHPITQRSHESFEVIDNDNENI